jgi:CcmD family protein
MASLMLLDQGGDAKVAFVLFRRQTQTWDMSSLAYLAAVNLVIWVGLFFYLWRLDRRISHKGGDP